MVTIPLKPDGTSAPFALIAAQSGRAGRLLAAAALLGLAAACAATSTLGEGGEARLRVASLSAPITAATPDETTDAGMRAHRATGRAEGAVALAEAPFLQGSPAGRAYLATAAPKALARGEPPGQCYGLGLATGPDAPAEALRRCFAEMAEDPREAGCGCRLLAIDDILLAERAAFAYAPGVSGRLLGPEAPQSGALVVAERPSEREGAALAAFFGFDGPVAVAELGADGEAILLLPGDAGPYRGARERWGWRRGRLTERLLLSSPEGRRLIALIGFEPADIAAEGPALGAWPRS